MKLALAFTILGLAASGCGKDAMTLDPEVDASGSGAIDASVPDGWTKLISRTWETAPGVLDHYECKRVQVPEDMWISGFQTLSPLGTHHEVLTITDGTPPQVGEYPCSAQNLDQKMLYASGVGTDQLLFPAGTAIKLAKNSYININLHLFNAGDTMLAGESGVLVKKVDAAAVQKELGMLFGGTYNISVAPDGQSHTVSGSCTTKAWEIYALWPHMHQIATHQKVSVAHATGPTETLLDVDYTFNDQKYYPMTSITTVAGDQLSVQCTYNNPVAFNGTVGGSTVTFGDSSRSEMCFSGMYTYPAPSSLFECTQ